jgi:hypothetical protein
VKRLTCAQVREMAPELALGNLCGDERAEAITHVEACPSCQELVSSLTAVTDGLLAMGPTAEPPAGFEARVLAAIAPPAAPERHRVVSSRPRRIAALAVAACIVVGLLVAAFGRSTPSAFATADMRTASGDVVGEVYVRRAAPTVVLMTLPGWATQMQRNGWSGGTYALRVEHRDGSLETRPISLDANATVATTIDAAPGTVRRIAVIDDEGYVWCEARLS